MTCLQLIGNIKHEKKYLYFRRVQLRLFFGLQILEKKTVYTVASIYSYCSYLLETVHAKQWFVSRYDGTFESNCGLTASLPCKTIQQVTVHASDGDIINIDGTGTSRDPYPCRNEKGLDLTGLVLRSYKSRPLISCRTNGLRFFCGIASRGVFLEEITFVNTSIHLFECSLNMVACSFINSSVPTLTLKYHVYFMRNVQLNGCIFQNNSASSITIYGNSSVNLNVSNSTFVSNKIHGEEDAILSMSIQNLQENQRSIKANFTDIRVSHNNCSGQACFQVFAGINGADLVLVMERVLFENNAAEVNILDVHGFSNGHINIKSTQFRKNTGRAVKIHNGNSVDLKIETSIFSGNGIPYSRIKPWWDYDESNGGAVLVDGFTQDAWVSMHGSNFHSNKGGSGGACAFISISRSLLVNIKNCQFVGNKGRFSGGAVAVGSFSKRLHYSDWIRIHGSEFSGNKLLRDLCDHFVCGGGAVGLYAKHVGNLSIINDTFTDNQAEEKTSGAIYVEVVYLYADVEIENSEFLRNCATTGISTLEMFFLYSSQPQVTLQNLTFINNSGDVNNTLTNKGVTSDIYIHCGNSYVVLRSCKIQKNSGGGIQVDLTDEGRHLDGRVSFVMESTFISENINFFMGIYITKQAFETVYHLKNVLFVNNNCNGEYSCISITALNSNSSFHLEQSSFLNNFGSSGVLYIVPSEPGKSTAQLRTIINNSEFRNNSGGVESILTLLNFYAIEIQNCNFIDNFGGAVSSHINIVICPGNLKIWKTSFYQSVETQVVYTVGGQSKGLVTFNSFLAVTQSEHVTIRKTSFILDPFSADSKAMVFIERGATDILDGSVRIESPVNTMLNMQLLRENYSSHNEQVTRVAVWFSAQRCPAGTYSIRRGIHSGYSVKEQVNCHSCPVGGNCSSSLAAQPNFWGYPGNNDTVTFQLCPEGYCCLPSVDNKCFYDNNSYLLSGCQGNSTGFLCGQCKRNFTEGLFTTECVQAKDCTQSWYLAVFFALTSSFALYLIRKPPVFETVVKHLTWFIPRRKEEKHQVTCSPDSTVKISVFPNYGFLKIIFYFYQVAGVLTVSSYGVKNLLRNEIALPIENLLNFKLYARINWKICPWPIFTPLLKTMVEVVTVMTIFFSIPVIYLLHSGLNKLCKRMPTFPPAGPYLGAVLEIVLLGYSAVTGTTVRLLHCVSIQEMSRWYYDAQYFCWNQWWQEAAFVVIALNLFPFIFTLYFASRRLYQGRISGKMFLLASILPFPYLLSVFFHYVKKIMTKRPEYQAIPSTANSFFDEEHDINSFTSIKHSLLGVLCGPFTKPQDDQSKGRTYWESILIGRRFLIIVIGWWQLEHALMRSVCLTILCLVFLLHHISQKPFEQSCANVTETVSLAILVVIGVLNVGLASAGSDVSGISQPYFSILLASEAVLLCIIPIVFAVFLSLSLVLQIVRVVIILLEATRKRWLIFKQKHDLQLLPPDGD